MLRIRLQRGGRKNTPYYRLVLTEHSSPVKSKGLVVLGRYNPLEKTGGFVYDAPKVHEWIKKGAHPTDTVARLLKGAGEQGLDAFIIKMVDRNVKNPKKQSAAPEGESVKTPETIPEAPEGGPVAAA